jgi:hypothetical protein
MAFFGKFTKGNATAISANFSESGGENCDDGCKLKATKASEAGGMCYARKIEKIYPNVKQAGIEKRKLSPTQICNALTLEARKIRNVWVRFSVLGSLPMQAKAEQTKGFKKAFQLLVKEIEASQSKIHLPIEEKTKAEFYQGLVNEVSDNVVVRESCQSLESLKTSENHRSYVIGTKGTPMLKRINEAKQLAAELRESGESSVVCAAIKPRNHKGRKVKCGDCTACAEKSVKVVLYPLH